MNANKLAAQQVVETLPLVMRALGSRLRKIAGMPSNAHFGILYMLAGKQKNLSDMARQHNVSMPTMSNSVTTLVQHGLVQRRRADHDRRQVVIELTDAGRAVLQQVNDEAVAYIEEFLTGLSREEVSQLQQGLDVLKTAFIAPRENGADQHSGPAA